MPREKKVRDLMIPVAEYATVSAGATVAEAVAVLKNSFCRLETGECYGHRSVLVLDEAGRPLGLLTFRDLLRAIEPRYLAPEKSRLPVDWNGRVPEVFWEGMFTERVLAEAQKKVREILPARQLLTVEADDPLMKAAHLMLRHNVGTIPVLEEGRVVGMIRINEVFLAIADAVITAPKGG
ncbi:MAG: CBS domain-containing protein [Desulfotomaculales bacterium]